MGAAKGECRLGGKQLSGRQGVCVVKLEAARLGLGLAREMGDK
jgi:hypothetical protein